MRKTIFFLLLGISISFANDGCNQNIAVQIMSDYDLKQEVGEIATMFPILVCKSDTITIKYTFHITAPNIDREKYKQRLYSIFLHNNKNNSDIVDRSCRILNMNLSDGSKAKDAGIKYIYQTYYLDNEMLFSMVMNDELCRRRGF
ncbi:hypothetical protein [uncultured Campylobacter sp.]|uniref:hypothetical protein n=1 Tax=uncultured Campylobacter sp. TaxID=218934 RepID=UPI00261FA128|nr:hypothetical protein [uncultured Campylobacter sp.]